MSRCVTSRSKLDSVSEAQGCRRCQACRAKRPGRVYRRVEQKRTPLKPQTKGRRFGGQIEMTIHARGRKEAVTCRESWWIGMSREQFQIAAAKRFPLNGNYNEIPMSPQARIQR